MDEFAQIDIRSADYKIMGPRQIPILLRLLECFNYSSDENRDFFD
jgi:hypothetical protein